MTAGNYAALCQRAFQCVVGIRQCGLCGILSPVLFNMYADVLINQLCCTGLGCYVGSVAYYVGCIAYADDMILLSSSVKMLQKVGTAYKDQWIILGI